MIAPGVLEKKKGPEVSVSVIPVSGSQTSLSDVEHCGPTVDVAGGDGDAPDGGAVAWRQVVAGHFLNAIACGYGATFGIYQLYYTGHLNLPASQVAWIGSLQIFLNNAVCVVGGPLADAGYGRAAVLAGSVLVVLGTFLTSLATEYWQILMAQGVMTGLGLGLMWMPSTTIVSSYFDRRKSLALTIASAGTGTGSIIFPATVQYLIPKIGFAWAVRCAGFVALAICVVGNLLLKPRLAPRKGATLVDISAFKESSYTIFAVGTFFFYWALYFGFFYINSFALTLPAHAFSATSTVNLLLLTNAVSMPARVLVGYIADNCLGPMNTYIASVATLSVTLFAWTAVKSGPGMWAWAAAFGIANGASQAAFISGLASLTRDPKTMGVRFGMVCGIVAFATLAGPPTAGAIIDATGGSYRWAQIWGGSCEFLAMLILMVARWCLEKSLWVRV